MAWLELPNKTFLDNGGLQTTDRLCAEGYYSVTLYLAVFQKPPELFSSWGPNHISAEEKKKKHDEKSWLMKTSWAKWYNNTDIPKNRSSNGCVNQLRGIVKKQIMICLPLTSLPKVIKLRYFWSMHVLYIEHIKFCKAQLYLLARASSKHVWASIHHICCAPFMCTDQCLNMNKSIN